MPAVLLLLLRLSLRRNHVWEEAVQNKRKMTVATCQKTAFGSC